MSLFQGIAPPLKPARSLNVSQMPVIQPQPGPQTLAMSSRADILVYGGAAGGGKTFTLLVDPLRHKNNPKFNAVFFRRTYPQITLPGGMWDESEKIYPQFKARPTKSRLKWDMPSGATFSFHHMQHEMDKSEWQGAQIENINFDELTHFTESQFWYLLSRNRSLSGIKPYMRGSCNPDANSWVKQLVLPWVDTNVDIAERPASGSLKYFVRVDGKIEWVDETYRYTQGGVTVAAKSFTFIKASVFDNMKLLNANPEYLANLRSLPLIEQERLLYGNWDIVESGNMFRKEWFDEIDPFELPTRFKRLIRFWDLASSKPNEVEKNKSNPDYTAGALVGVGHDGMYYFLDLVMVRDTPGEIESLLKKTCREDIAKYGTIVEFAYEQEPGSSGVFVTHHFTTTVFKGFRFKGFESTGSKIARANPVSAEIQNGGTFKIARGRWNAQFYALASAFPKAGVHDDAVDALSGAYNYLNAPDDTVIYVPTMAHTAGWGAGTSAGAMSFTREDIEILKLEHSRRSGVAAGVGAPNEGRLAVRFSPQGTSQPRVHRLGFRVERPIR